MTINLGSLDEKWLLVGWLRRGQLWKDQHVLRGQSWLNLHSKTFRQIAQQLAAPQLARTGQTLVSQPAVALLLGQACQRLQARDQLKYFTRKVSDTSGLSPLLAASWQELRLAGLETAQLHDDCFEVPDKAHDLRAIYGLAQQQLQQCNWIDYADLLRIALTALDTRQSQIPQRLIIWQPEAFPVSRLEHALLEQLIAQGARYVPPTEQPSAAHANMRVQAAIGSINEVRGLLQTILYHPTGPLPLDHVEVVHTDYATYVPLILETITQMAPPRSDVSNATGVDAGQWPTLDELPITFAEGIACVYSRPGRLLRSWVRWLKHDCYQSKAVQMVREGLLQRPDGVALCGYARLAHTLRSIPVGYGLSRYLPQLDETLRRAQQQYDDFRANPENAADLRDFGLSALRTLRATLQPLVALTPPPMAEPELMLQAARQLLENVARADSQLDRLARWSLIDQIDWLLQLLRTQPQALSDVSSWLEELPVRSQILASSPQPGCIHVAALEQGGASGRRHTFIVGLDDDRFPKRQTVDPILLDDERRRLSVDLPTTPQRNQYQQAALERVLTRSRQVSDSEVVLYYSTHDLIEDRLQLPSSELSRLDAAQSQTPIAFVCDELPRPLTSHEGEQQRLLEMRDRAARESYLWHHYLHLASRAQHQQAVLSERFSRYDGLVVQAGQDVLAQLNETVMSPSRLELLGTCPRKYFFQRILGVRPPDHWDVNPDRWLSPLEMGSLLHELLETFVRQILPERRAPGPQDRELLWQVLDEQLARWAARVPPPSQQAWQDTRDDLHETCEVFLNAEQLQAASHNSRPLHVEVALGSAWGNRQQAIPLVDALAGNGDDASPSSLASSSLDTTTPVTITLPNGYVLQLAGRVDRIDQVQSDHGPKLMIWDYKSGSDSTYALDKPFDQGRHLQPYLYLRMIEARLRQLGGDGGEVYGFGYFFLGHRSEGRRMLWSAADLNAGGRLIEHMIGLLSAGTFTATDRATDCGRCDFASICGPAGPLVELTKWKTQSQLNPELDAWRQLRQK